MLFECLSFLCLLNQDVGRDIYLAVQTVLDPLGQHMSDSVILNVISSYNAATTSRQAKREVHKLGDSMVLPQIHAADELLNHILDLLIKVLLALGDRPGDLRHQRLTLISIPPSVQLPKMRISRRSVLLGGRWRRILCLDVFVLLRLLGLDIFLLRRLVVSCNWLLFGVLFHGHILLDGRLFFIRLLDRFILLGDFGLGRGLRSFALCTHGHSQGGVLQQALETQA
mmetsp:Transcript_53205/g.116783  ORF Transcript_53205/g.116783 Transcript_53205/m.116783 type:complete len:226 (+) Transcript_53205:3044-3721(+)